MVMDNIIGWMLGDLGSNVSKETWKWPPSCKSPPPYSSLLHLGAPLQSAHILDNERSLEGEATAEITDPL